MGARAAAEGARGAARRGGGWYAALARTGLVAKGVSYGLVGVLAVQLALGEGGEATSRTGALEEIARSTWGKALIGALAAGFAAYAAWRLVQAAVAEDEGDGSDAKLWAKRAGYAARGAVYVALTVTTVRILAGSGGGGSQDEKAQQTTATALTWPGGRWLVVAAGACLAAAAVWNAYRGIARKFEKRWNGNGAGGRSAGGGAPEGARASAAERRWGSRAGLVGHVARGVVFGLIAAFLVKAAAEYDPEEAIGLDGALQKLAATGYGQWALGVTAAGLVAYGVFCLADARLRDVSART